MAFFRHGVLTLPLSFMLCFGLLGFRAGQIFNKIIGFVINSMFILNYVLVVAIGTGYLIANNYEGRVTKFYSGFVIVIMIQFTFLNYIYYKKSNLISILEDITLTRQHKLSKKEILFVIFTFLSVVVSSGIIVTEMSKMAISIFTNGCTNFFAFKTDDHLQCKLMSVLVILIYRNYAWISFLATSFLISIIAVVLRGEFSKCIEDLQDKINETNTLTSETFSETIERFQKLRILVQQNDDTFCLILSLNLGLALGLLCTTIYSSYIGEIDYEIVDILVPLATVIVLLPSSAALHSKVSRITSRK